MKHQAGFVGIVGKPNVGKSTFSNELIGERLSIISSKAQTTRHRILGIINEDHYHLVISDTPGVIKPAYKLQENMMEFIGEIFTDSDILLAMIAVDDPDLPEDVLNRIKKLNSPCYLLINKCDLSSAEEVGALVSRYQDLGMFTDIIALSAINGIDKKGIITKILEHIPEHPAFYPKDQLTDKPERFFVEEMVREAIFNQFRQEIPYSTQVEVLEFKENKKIIKILATIFTERQSQKGILIGPGGEGIKRIGTSARKACEAFFGKKVFLDLRVSTKKDWRKNELHLKRFGYQKKK